jgi:hypothetical protein
MDNKMPKTIIREDGEKFFLNDDGETYSCESQLKDPEHLIYKWHISAFFAKDFKELVARPTIHSHDT